MLPPMVPAAAPIAKPTGPPKLDKPAERRSPKGANGKITFRLGSDTSSLR